MFSEKTQDFIDNFRYNSIIYPILINILILIVLYIILSFFCYQSNILVFSSNNIQSIFGILIQSQATIFTLIITLSFIAAQIASSNYSAYLMELFRKNLNLWILIVVYLISIVINIFIIFGDFSSINKIFEFKFLSIQLNSAFIIYNAFIFAIFSIFALIPFINSNFKLLSPIFVIKKLGCKKIVKNNEKKENPLQIIFEITIIACNKYNIGIFRAGLNQITKVHRKIIENLNFDDDQRSKILREFHQRYFILCDLSLKNKFEAGLIICIEQIYTFIKYLMDKNYDYYEFTELLNQIGISCIYANLSNPVNEVINQKIEIIKNIIDEQKYDIKKYEYNDIKELCALSLKKNIDPPIVFSIDSLSKFGLFIILKKRISDLYSVLFLLSDIGIEICSSQTENKLKNIYNCYTTLLSLFEIITNIWPDEIKESLNIIKDITILFTINFIKNNSNQALNYCELIMRIGIDMIKNNKVDALPIIFDSIFKIESEQAHAVFFSFLTIRKHTIKDEMGCFIEFKKEYYKFAEAKKSGK